MASAAPSYTTLKLTPHDNGVLHVEINRPKKLNAMNSAFWKDMRECFQAIGRNKNVKAVVLSAAGKIFTAGLDLMDAAGTIMADKPDQDVSRRAFDMRAYVLELQESFMAIENIPQPVIVAIHSACIGGGVDLISACDVRLCTEDATFCIKEVDVGLAADLGTLQRCCKIIGNHSLLRELAYTGRNMGSEEALRAGLVSSVHKNKEAMMQAAFAMASQIAAKSPIAVVGTKHVLNYSRDHSIEEGLRYVATWNMAMLQSKDLLEAVQASMEKRKPIFSKL
eukprot:TRINITY_DN2835_c0_g1_i1.p1 TRINITY_DN2835_c0_g1~~TRINITY_DN2835_c0_g1_i1.p1  ORF type:complete len:299 (+),score=97.65 TRINITY_DN2835_c0_g1_i1:59-898(+)